MPSAAASSWRNRCRAAIGSTRTGVRVSCGGTTSQSSVADLAAATASESAACRAAAGVTPDASYAGVEGGSGEGADDRAAYRRRPARRAMAASKISTHRAASTSASHSAADSKGPGPQPVPQVVVGAEPEQRRGHAGDRLGRDEQPVHLVPDDLPRTGGTVEGHAGDTGRHRLLQPEREPLGP